MTDGVIFGWVFVGFFILRVIVATIFFYCVLPKGHRCPCCDAPTIRVQSKGWNTLMPWFRTSWCYGCNWTGFLRHGMITREPATRRPTSAPHS